MGRRPKSETAAPATLTAAAPGTEPEAPGDPNEQTTDQLAAGAEEGQKTPRARVTRWNDQMRTYATLDYVPAANIDELWIRDEYGGGKYLVYFFGTRNDGSYGYLKNKQKEFIIDDSIPFKGAQRGRKPLTGDVHDGPVPPGTSLMDMGLLQLFKTMQDNSTLVVSMMRDNSTAQAAMLERIAAPREGALEKILPLLVPVVTAIIQQQGQKKDPMDIAREFAQLMKSNESGGGVREAMGVMKDMLEMRELLGPSNGDSDGEAGWMRILEKVVPGAIEVLKAEAMKRGTTLHEVARPPQPRLPRPAMTAPGTAPSPAPTSPRADSASSVALPSGSPVPAGAPAPVADEWTGLEPHVATLAAMAAEDREPYGVMQTIKTLAPRSLLAAIRELVARDDATDVLVARFPVLARHRAWLEQLLDEFHAEFFGEEEDETPAGPGEDPTLGPDVNGQRVPLEEE